jgi:hypothetical protein
MQEISQTNYITVPVENLTPAVIGKHVRLPEGPECVSGTVRSIGKLIGADENGMRYNLELDVDASLEGPTDFLLRRGTLVVIEERTTEPEAPEQDGGYAQHENETANTSSLLYDASRELSRQNPSLAAFMARRAYEVLLLENIIGSRP